MLLPFALGTKEPIKTLTLARKTAFFSPKSREVPSELSLPEVKKRPLEIRTSETVSFPLTSDLQVFVFYLSVK